MISSNMNGLLLAHTAEEVRVCEVLSPESHERDYRCSASFPGSDGLKNVDGNTHAGMDGVIHVVTTALVDNVNVVRVVPTVRPGINESERIAAIAETVMIVVASRPHQMLGVHSFQSCVKGNRSGRGVEWRLFWFRANFPWMIGANMSSELGVT